MDEKINIRQRFHGAVGIEFGRMENAVKTLIHRVFRHGQYGRYLIGAVEKFAVAIDGSVPIKPGKADQTVAVHFRVKEINGSFKKLTEQRAQEADSVYQNFYCFRQKLKNESAKCFYDFYRETLSKINPRNNAVR